MNTDLLKEILAVPTATGRETKLVLWLVDYFRARDLKVDVDPIGNVYVTKGVPPTGGAYPCVCAHTDTVHEPQDVIITEFDFDKIIAIDDDGKQTGLGGDDKSGIFICLELISASPVIKAVFFVSEETGCHGSHACDREFFEDVGYVIEYDSPCEDIMTYTCNGVQLFPDEGPFIDTILPLLDAHGVTKWQRHPYTDVSVLKALFPFPCLNLPAGYFLMHSKREYVSRRAVQNAIVLGQKLIGALGLKRYRYEAVTRVYGNPVRPVTGLETHG